MTLVPEASPVGTVLPLVPIYHQIHPGGEKLLGGYPLADALYNSHREEVVQAILPPDLQPAAQVQTVTDKLTQEMQIALQSDSW